MKKMRGIIDVKKIDKTIGEFKILSDINFYVPTGSITAFIGSNGSGKTTTIKTILGLYPMYKTDQIFINGKDARDVSAHDAIRYVPEKEEFPNIDAWKFLYETSEYYGINKEDAKTQILFYARELGFNEKYFHKKINKLSSGNKKIINIIQGLIGSPKVVIMDEPTENLDPVVKTLFWKLIRSINKSNGITFFISSHNLDEIEKTISHIVVIRLGVLSWQGDWKFKGGLRERFDQFNLTNQHEIFTKHINKELVAKINLMLKKKMITKSEAQTLKNNIF